jgi:hypothetical protein
MLLAAVAVAAICTLMFPRPWALVAVGLGSAAIWLVTANLPLELTVRLSDLGFSLTSDVETKWLLVLMLPSSVIWLIAGVAGMLRANKLRPLATFLAKSRDKHQA